MTPDPSPRRAIPPGMAITPWAAPDGWRHRRFDWPSDAPRPRGSLIFQTGRADYIEKYLETLHHFHGRGWHLAGFDWRGQGGSGRFLPDRRIGHLPGLDPLVDDLASFAADWFARMPRPHVLVGHSMGGHLTLRVLAEREVAVDAAVLVAPMLGFATGRVPQRFAAALARLACRIGLARRPAWPHAARSARGIELRRRNLTGSAERFADSVWWKEQAPELGLGAPSWGWLDAAQGSMARLLRAGAVERIATPLLFLATPRDRLVSAEAIAAMVKRLPHARLKLFPQGAHELLREEDAVRLPVLAAIDSFLDAEAAVRV